MMVGRKNWLKRFKMEKRRLNYPFIVSRKSVIGSEQNVFSQGKKSKQSKAKQNTTKQSKTKLSPKLPPLRATALFYATQNYCHKHFTDLKLAWVAVFMTIRLKNSRRYLKPERTGIQNSKTYKRIGLCCSSVLAKLCDLWTDRWPFDVSWVFNVPGIRNISEKLT